MTPDTITDAEVARMAADYAQCPAAFWLEWAVDEHKRRSARAEAQLLRNLTNAYAQQIHPATYGYAPSYLQQHQNRPQATHWASQALNQVIG